MRAVHALTAALLCCCLLQGCAGLIAPADATQGKVSGTITVKAVLLDEASHELPPPKPRRLAGDFPLVQGTLFGRPTQITDYTPAIVLGETFTLDLGQLESDARTYAKPLEGVMLQTALSVQPATLQLARVGTFFINPDGSGASGGAGFLDAETRHWIVLVYFDRAAAIKGRTEYEGVTDDIDITVPAAGLYWIEGVEVEGVWHLRRPKAPLKVQLGARHLLDEVVAR